MNHIMPRRRKTIITTVYNNTSDTTVFLIILYRDVQILFSQDPRDKLHKFLSLLDS